MTSDADARTEQRPRERTAPPVTTWAWASLAVVAVAVLAGLIASEAMVAVGLGQDGSGYAADTLASLVVTGLTLGWGSHKLGSRLGVPTPWHLAAGAAGGALLGLATFLTGAGVIVPTIVLVTYVAVSVVGLHRGAASAMAS